ncbi:MAG: trypsin-like peptidase domain-containing protein [Burkholderiaceae bacterium]|nr:trypsin-like peptidase domain-containing protein [Burkholderiaceae bacterium]
MKRPETTPSALRAIRLGSLLLYAACVAVPAHAQSGGLPPTPVPVPGSLLDAPHGRSPLPAPAEGSGATARPGAAAAAAPGRAAPARRNSSGSGFYVTVDGHLLTNRHVVAGCTLLARGDGARLTLLASDAANDLALLKGPPVIHAAALRAAADARQGEEVLTYGFPLQGMLSSAGQLGAGMVSALAGLRDNPAQLQIDVPVQPGNSGGPLLDRRGQVIGMVVAKLNALRVAQITGDIPQNINFAIKLAPVKTLLEANGVQYLRGTDTARTLSNFEIADLARSFTTPVFCQR